MTSVTVDLPDVNEAFEKSPNMDMFHSNYMEMLRETNVSENIQHANKLLEYSDIDKNLPFIRKEAFELQNFSKNWSKKNNATVKTKGRIKAWWEFNAKIVLARQNSPNNTDFSSVRDLYGFKLIVGQYENNIELCYKLANDTLLYFLNQKHYTLLNAEKNVCYTSPNQLIPKHKQNVKDYYAYPKPEDNYRALHFYVKSHDGIILEIQVVAIGDYERSQRTHKNHKTKKYANLSLEFDYKKINFPDVIFNEKGELLCDLAGLFESKNIFEI